MIVFIARTMGSIGRRSGSSFVAVAAALVADEYEDDDEEVAASADDDGRGTSSSSRMLGEVIIALAPERFVLSRQIVVMSYQKMRPTETDGTSPDLIALLKRARRGSIDIFNDQGGEGSAQWGPQSSVVNHSMSTPERS